MFVQKINPSTQQNFSAVRPERPISVKVFRAVKNTPSVKKFAENFDAKLSVTEYLSKTTSGKIRYALQLKDIKPVSLIERMKNFLGLKKHNKEIVLKTCTSNNEDFIKSINNEPENTLIDLCYKRTNK